MSESAHQKITDALRQQDEQEHEVRTLAQQVSEATGEQLDLLLLRWRDQALDAVRADLRQQSPYYSGGLLPEDSRWAEQWMLYIAQREQAALARGST